ESEWELNLVHAATQRVKRRVDPQMYQIFDFYVNKEWPPEKVAKAFKITVNQVYLAKHRILEAMKEEIAKIEKNNI
ncbi:MAG TPA: sigma-70 family RNA polymerase sigma factor, partial [Verrucomicrobiae bacterium]